MLTVLFSFEGALCVSATSRRELAVETLVLRQKIAVCAEGRLMGTIEVLTRHNLHALLSLTEIALPGSAQLQRNPSATECSAVLHLSNGGSYVSNDGT